MSELVVREKDGIMEVRLRVRRGSGSYRDVATVSTDRSRLKEAVLAVCEAAPVSTLVAQPGTVNLELGEINVSN